MGDDTRIIGHRYCDMASLTLVLRRWETKQFSYKKMIQIARKFFRFVVLYEEGNKEIGSCSWPCTSIDFFWIE